MLPHILSFTNLLRHLLIEDLLKYLLHSSWDHSEAGLRAAGIEQIIMKHPVNNSI